MSRIRNNLLGGSNIPKAPSKRDVEAMIKKRKEDEKELIEKMNIPPRDVEKYPMPDETDMKNSAAFIYTLNVLAESYDENLKALMWKYNSELMKYMRANSTQEDLLNMMTTLTDLKEYIAKSKNPLFTDKI